MTCPHGMPKPSTCVDCMEEGPVTTPKLWAEVGPVFAAKFPNNQCPCGNPVIVGQPIQRWDRGEGLEQETKYTHENCRP